MSTPNLRLLPEPESRRLRAMETEVRARMETAGTARKRDMYRTLAANLAACADEVDRA